jgi:hypothetical protein
MSNSDITDRTDWMKNGREVECRQMPQHLNAGCLECAADVLSKVLDLSCPVLVPEELVQAAIRVFPAPPPPVKPSMAPALPVLAPRFTYRLEDRPPGPLQVDADAADGIVEAQPQPASAEVPVAASSKR